MPGLKPAKKMNYKVIFLFYFFLCRQLYPFSKIIYKPHYQMHVALILYHIISVLSFPFICWSWEIPGAIAIFKWTEKTLILNKK